MATTVVSAAGVIAAPKAAAQTIPQPSIQVQYRPGSTQRFGESQCNFQSAYLVPGVGVGAPSHREYASYNWEYAYLVSSPTNNGINGAQIGIFFQLNGVDSTSLTKPCKITVRESHQLFVSGSDNTFASLEIHPTFSTGKDIVVTGTNGGPQWTASRLNTETFSGTVGDFFNLGANNHAYGFVLLQVNAGNQVDSGIAYARATLVDVQLQF